ncbi:MAG TPA: aldo/keto reductase [Candidatus Dormibacteraeota bacterium]|nr:aldo/keto reductase [Candidatus Dormibacteraeota bacterium]
MKLGDLAIARIGLGTNRLTHTPEHVEFIRSAVEAGVQMIDTAHLYTGTQSEKTIGEAVTGTPNVVVVATKGGFNPGEGKPDVLRAQIEESLRNLRTEAITLYFLHRVHPDTPLEVSLGAIQEQVDRKKIRFVGISEVDVDQIERARKVLPIHAVQNRYNLADRKWDAVVDYCDEEGIVFVPFFPLREGHSAAVDEVARKHRATPSQVMLAWLLKRSPVMLPIPGTLSLEHLKENLAAQKIELTKAEYESLA